MIYIPKICGTCGGASFALNLVNELYERELKKDKPKRIVIYKEILHNKEVIKNLEKKNIICINDLSEIKNNDIVVIRAHGEGKSFYDYLNKRNVEYYDATCKNVLKIHDIVKEKTQNDYFIIIIGKKQHPEVEGTNGWCHNNAYIISDINEIDNLHINNNKILIVCQTTTNNDMAIKIANKIKANYSDKQIEFINTTCHATKITQKYSVETAKKCNYMIVIGGANSFNTKELYNVCSKVCPSIMVSDIMDIYAWLKRTTITQNTKIGLTGGASTTKEEIFKIQNLIEFYLFYNSQKKLFEKKINNYNHKFLNEKDNLIVKNAINKLISINSGGKYLRAMLISLGYFVAKKCGANEYMPLSIAYETFQTSILIHDDIIDNAKMRRGRDTIPVMYKKDFSIENDEGIGNNLGICIGDLGFYFTNKILYDNYAKSPYFASLIKYYNDIVINTIKGEIIDVKLPFDVKYKYKKECKMEDILEIYKLKTSYYTIVGPFCLGSILGGANKQKIKIYENVLENIGIAFQIKDDIMGIFGSEEQIGKTNSDIEEFKQTILYAYVYSQKGKYLDELNKYYGKKNLSKEEIEIVKEIFVKSGALEYANKIMDDLFEESTAKIQNLNIESKYKNILLGFITYLQTRQK